MGKHVPLVCVGGLAVHTCDWHQFQRVFKRTQPQRPFFVIERTTFDNCMFSDKTIPADLWDAELAHLHTHICKIVKMYGPVQLLGHSMGGLLAEAFARLYPSLVRKLVLVDSASPDRYILAEYNHVPTVQQISPLGTSLFSRALIRSFPVFVSALALARGNTLSQTKLLRDIYGTENAVRYFFAELGQEEVWVSRLVKVSHSHPLQIPCLVLAAPGNLSSWIPSQKSWVRAQRDFAEKLASETKHVPSAGNRKILDFEVIPHATHMVMLSAATALNAITYLK